MNDINKAVRIALYQEVVFLGAADWAVDLQWEDGNENNAGLGITYIDPATSNEPRALWPFTVRNECISSCINTAFGICYGYVSLIDHTCGYR
ncbi:hypothetical protein BDV06DRAFT_226594 [Aspergillus oleicola]